MPVRTNFTAIKRLLMSVLVVLAMFFAVVQGSARGLDRGVAFLAATTLYKSSRQYQSLSVANVQCSIFR